jgi:drug/metabolite transporter (DMT)-like permease
VALLSTAALAGIPIRAASPSALLYLGLAALIPQVVGHSLLTWALRHTTPTVVGLSTVGEPVGSTLLGLLVLSEVPSGPTVVGCVITLSAVVLALSARRDDDRSEVAV